MQRFNLMSKIFVISDTHFSHANILNFKDDKGDHFRGDRFKNVDEMNEFMVSQWNSVVRPEDKVYHLGDVYFGPQEKADRLLSRLVGHKRLILGNHDKGKDTVLLKHFEKIMVSRVFREFGFLLTHIPVHPGSLREDKYGRNVHGHIHQNSILDKRYVNVSVEQIDYKPVELMSLV